MADLRVKSTGREFRRVDNATALLLEELFPGDLERINAPARNPHSGKAQVHPDNAVNLSIPDYKEPLWGVGRSAVMDLPTITLHFRNAQYAYHGSVEGAAFHFKSTGCDLPKTILEQYANLRKQVRPSVSTSDAERNRLDDAQAKNNAAPALPYGATFGIESVSLPEFPRKDADGKYL